MPDFGRKQPKQARSAGTVEAIYQAFTRILDREGPLALTTNKIAQVAGVSVGSLYQYFRNKEGILEALLVRMTTAQLERLEKLIAETEPGTVTLNELVALIIRAQYAGMCESGKSTPYLLQYAQRMLPLSHFRKSDERIADFLIRKIHHFGFLTRVKDPKPAFIVCSQTVRTVMFMTYMTREPEERERHLEELIRMLGAYLESLDREG